MKRIEVRKNGFVEIANANSVNLIRKSKTSEKDCTVYFGNIGSEWHIGERLNPFGNEKADKEAEQLIKDVDNFIYNDAFTKQKMVIEIGEFKNLVEEGYIIVSFDVINDADSPYKIDDSLVSVAAANSTIRFDVKVCDETLSDDDAIAEARKRLCSIIGEREYFDGIDLSRIRPSYDTSYVRVSYE